MSTYASPQQTGGANSIPVYNVVISVDTNNVNLRTIVNGLGYVAGPAVVNCTINPGIVVGSTSTSVAAFATGSWTALPVTLNLVISAGAYIVGKGGNAGNGAGQSGPNPGRNGSAGGPALEVAAAITVNNLATIGGGGGGGGGGGNDGGAGGAGGGGGGGAGQQVGSLGTNGGGGSGNGVNGTLTTGGAFGPGWGLGGGGGAGGDLGANGNDGVGLGYAFPAGTGGAAGNAVSGNSLIAWTNTGTRLGPIT